MKTVKTILIVDDNEEMKWLLSETLRSHGYRVFIANSGNEALAQLDLLHPDLVLSDIEMEDGDGFDLLDGIQQKGSSFRPPVAMISAHSEITPAEVKARGAVTLFRKPFEVDLLTDWIQAFLARHE